METISKGGGIPIYLSHLPFDRNIAGKRITEFHHAVMSGNSAWNVNSTLTKKHYGETMKKVLRTKRQQLEGYGKLLRIPLIRTRSQLVADYLIDLLTPALGAAEHVIDRANAQFDLLRLAVALERYKSAMGEYPSDLEALVPQFLEEVPLDPFTGRKTFVYQLAPDDETAFLLHSSEWDESDKDSIRANLFIRCAAERFGF